MQMVTERRVGVEFDSKIHAPEAKGRYTVQRSVGTRRNALLSLSNSLWYVIFAKKVEINY